MTAANLLRLVRSCAKWWGGVLLVATLMACTPAGAAPTLRLLGMSAPGDSLKIGVNWGGAARATGYRITVVATGTNGSWTGLPSVQSNVTTSLQFTAVNVAWDSVTFTATVESVDAVGPTGKTSLSAPLKLKRRAGAPGPVTFDTTLTIIGARILPDSVTVRPNEVVQFCALVQFLNGMYALRAVDQGQPECATMYLSMIPAGQRLVSATQQARADSVCFEWSATGGTIEQEACAMNPAMLERRGLLFQVALR